MAILSSAAVHLERTSGLPSSTAWSFCAWCYWTSDNSAQGTIIQLNNSANTVWQSFGISSGSNLQIIITGFTTATFSSTPSVGQWFFVQARCSGVGAGLFNAAWSPFGSESLTSASLAGESYTVANMMMSDNDGSSSFLGRYGHIKIWDAALTDAEFQKEKYSARPQRTANLHIWTPARVVGEAGTDYSGNGKSWTVVGSYSTVDGPPVGWGAAPLWVGGAGAADVPADYGTPYAHDGVKPFSSLWRAGRM